MQKINTAIKNSGIKVKSQIQEDKIRVTGKVGMIYKKSWLFYELDLPMALEFNNYR